MSVPDPFEMLGSTNDSLRRASHAFELHQRAVALRERIQPLDVEDISVYAAAGPWVLLHPSFSKEIGNTSLLAMASICDHLARRLSPGLFDQN